MSKTIKINGLEEKHWETARRILGPYQGRNLPYVKLSRNGKLTAPTGNSESFADRDHTEITSTPAQLAEKLPCSFILGPDNEIYAIQHEEDEAAKKREYDLFSKMERNKTSRGQALLSRRYSSEYLKRFYHTSRRVKRIINHEYWEDPLSPAAKQFLMKTRLYINTDDFSYEAGFSPLPTIRTIARTTDNHSNQLVDSTKTIQFFHDLGENLVDFLNSNRKMLSLKDRMLIAFLCCLESYKFQTGEFHSKPEDKEKTWIHCDVKPDNFTIKKIFNTNNEVIGYKTTLIDWESKVSLPKEGTEGYFPLNGTFGTKGFIPPESIEKSKVNINTGKTNVFITHTRDVFALGETITHDILHGIHLSDSLSLLFVPMKSSYENRPPLIKVLKDIYQYGSSHFDGFFEGLKASLGNQFYRYLWSLTFSKEQFTEDQ